MMKNFFLSCFLVHFGIISMAQPTNSASAGNAVLFIHGMGGSSLSWQETVTQLPANGYYYLSNIRVISEENFLWTNTENKSQVPGRKPGLISFFTMDFSDNQNLTIKQQAKEINIVIETVREKYGKMPLVLVAHCMGGLAARRYIMDYGTSCVAGLVTLATPHLGSFFGYGKNLSSGLPARQLEPDFSEFVQNLKNYRLLDDRQLKRNPYLTLFEVYNNSVGLDCWSVAAEVMKPTSTEMKQLYMQEFPRSLPVAVVISDWQPKVAYDESQSANWFNHVRSQNLINIFDPNNGFDIVRAVIIPALIHYDNPEFKSIHDNIPTEVLISLLQDSHCDGIVTVNSQDMRYGVRNGSDLNLSIFYTNRFHTETPGDVDCLLRALKAVMVGRVE
ncbi:MAG: alpha/beta fold hydrolase [Bacteroidales bacterium]|nr:alpha/beta fold hydrolase [Bacteroidales bacterium]